MLSSRTVVRMVSFSLLLVSLPVLGGGGTGNQGPRFLGLGLDDATAVYGGYYSAAVQQFQLTSNSFPPLTEANIIQPATAFFKLKQLKCRKLANPPNPLLAKCEALVESTVPGPVCRQRYPATNKVPLIALDARWNSTDGSFVFGGSQSVIFACLDLSPGASDRYDVIGALGKCEGARFFQKSSDEKVFSACVRAMRADYCGEGFSFTLKGTPIAIYDWDPMLNQRVPDPNHPVCFGGQCFEASWKEDGANCINHARYEQLLRLSGQEKFSEAALRGPPVEYAKECRYGSLVPCGKRYDPLSKCLDKYTEFYYNDQYQIAGGGGFNTVSAVTAQYVCKSGETRPKGMVRTRTLVRFIPNGVAAPVSFPCCDTLGCP